MRFAAISKLIISSALITSIPAYGHSGRREHQAHIHGKAELSIAVDANSLQIDLSLPMADLLGYEHKPSTDSEKQKWQQAATLLSEPSKLLTLDAAASCVAQTVAPLTEPWAAKQGHEHKHGHKHEEKHDHQHWDIKAHYRFVCKDATLLKTLQVKLFDELSSLKEVAVQHVTPLGQGQKTLTPKEKSVELGK